MRSCTSPRGKPRCWPATSRRWNANSIGWLSDGWLSDVLTLPERPDATDPWVNPYVSKLLRDGGSWSEAEAEANIADAIRECLAARAEAGIPLTTATREIEVTV